MRPAEEVLAEALEFVAVTVQPSREPMSALRTTYCDDAVCAIGTPLRDQA
jgi:hypothetical protein